MRGSLHENEKRIGIPTRRSIDPAQHGEDQAEQRRGQSIRLALAPLLQQLGEHWDERGLQRRIGDQGAQ